MCARLGERQPPRFTAISNKALNAFWINLYVITNFTEIVYSTQCFSYTYSYTGNSQSSRVNEHLLSDDGEQNGT